MGQSSDKLSECLLKVAELVKSWKRGNEGAHLLRIRDLVEPFMAVEILLTEMSPEDLWLEGGESAKAEIFILHFLLTAPR